MKRMYGRTLGLALALAAVPGVSCAKVIERVGLAYDIESNRLLYTETHREVYDSDRVVQSLVVYRDADGEQFAEKNLDFRDFVLMPSFRLEDRRNGHLEGAAHQGERCEVVFREDHGEETVREFIAVPDKAIIDAGFDRFIEQHWQQLIAGESFLMPFLVPSYQKFLNFRIRAVDAPEGGEVTFRMEPKSVLLRFFADPIDVTYDLQTRALKRYLGVSNIKNPQGNNYDVRVDFPAERRRIVD